MMLSPDEAREMGVPEDLARPGLLRFLISLWKGAHW